LRRPDIITGGFPCQPVSVAGRRLGTADPRWLWPEYARAIRLLRPRYVVVENVPGILVQGFGDVLRDMALSGYDAEWDNIPAAAFGAPHLRYRVWIVGYARDGRRGRLDRGRPGPESSDGCSDVADADGRQIFRPPIPREKCNPWATESGLGGVVDGIPLGLDESGNPQWKVEPNIPRVAKGIQNRVARVKTLGNAIVPQIAEWLAERIKEYDRKTRL